LVLDAHLWNLGNLACPVGAVVLPRFAVGVSGTDSHGTVDVELPEWGLHRPGLVDAIRLVMRSPARDVRSAGQDRFAPGRGAVNDLVPVPARVACIEGDGLRHGIRPVV
jgi:hypothetical protein